MTTAAMTPSAIINPYALNFNGPMEIEPLDGLGMVANSAEIREVKCTF
jgi:hypothetical protein